ncbi:hypothetical protein CYLTODRAFT_243246 [Cylindrobasidium torrendii FP15055 ss-10]|uniref:Uncharacterized protein n=1 Tax=Cylindrobasidium torrendii FP15055 ss-10 TaxID=1314674 RepID=A0A0D7ASE5_9AGAR|nr:hypothetical protein CYLTODRAFT_243246 [Cylindrobasidium torrendii FP15055 ss-10]
MHPNLLIIPLGYPHFNSHTSLLPPCDSPPSLPPHPAPSSPSIPPLPSIPVSIYSSSILPFPTAFLLYPFPQGPLFLIPYPQ